jgi:hypothetical protein
MTKVKIQMKVYDTDGRRVAVEEALLPDGMSAEDAAKWVKLTCEELGQHPCP